MLVMRTLRSDVRAYAGQVLDVYRRRGLKDHLRRRIHQYRKHNRESPGAAGLERLALDHQLEKEEYELLATTNRGKEHNVSEREATLQRLILARRFRQACETLAHQRVSQGISQRAFEPPLLREMHGFYASQPTPEWPGIHLFYLATELYLKSESHTATDPVFDELKAGIETHIEDFPRRDQRNLLVLAINHCLRQSNAGRPDFLSRTLELYQLGLKRKLFYEGGEIGIFTFNNILGVALRVGETDWAERFLEAEVRRLPTSGRQEVESLSRARLAFQRRDYDATLGHLRTADYQDFIHHLTARVMQMKIYFARDDYNLLVSHLRSTQTLLRRRKNPGYHQQNYLNVFGLAERVLRLPPGNTPARAALRATINTTEPCTEKTWLLTLL